MKKGEEEEVERKKKEFKKVIKKGKYNLLKLNVFTYKVIQVKFEPYNGISE